MTDVVDKETRSRIMSSIKGKDTKGEVFLGRALWKVGPRYNRRNYSGLPGKPDFVYLGLRAIVMFNGCFWHKHQCRICKQPASRKWKEKIDANRDRDRRNLKKLEEAGWRIFIVWECAVPPKGKASYEEVAGIIRGWVLGDAPNMQFSASDGLIELPAELEFQGDSRE